MLDHACPWLPMLAHACPTHFVHLPIDVLRVPPNRAWHTLHGSRCLLARHCCSRESASSGLRELIQWSGVHRAVAPSKPSVALKPSVKPAAKPAPPRGAGKGKESRGARHFYLVVVRVRREDFVRSCAFGSCLLYRSLRAFALANALVHSIAALEEELTLTLCVPIRAP